MPGWTFTLRYGGRDIPLDEGDLVLGRSRGSGVRIDEESVSRSHALLSIHGDDALIRDLGSSNGLFVNGKRVNKETLLKNGDSIGLGSAIVFFVAVPPAAEVEAKTAMINVEPRPSRMVTQFIRPQAELAHPVPEPVRPVSPPARAHSAEDVVIRPEGEDAAHPAFDPALVPSRVTTTMESRPAGWFPRLFSGLADFLVVAALAGLCFAPALVAIVTHASLRETGGGGPVFWILVVFCGVVAVAAVCVYFLATLAGRGATLGQRVFGLRVVTEDEEVPKSGAVLARMVGMLLYVATAGLLFLPAAFSARGRGLADRISGTRVEKA